MNAISKPEVQQKQVAAVAIPRIDMRTIRVGIVGNAPLMINKFSAKAQEMIRAKHAAGSTAKKGKAREAKDFDALFEGARYRSAAGWDGINASAFRHALISACRLVGFKMTLAKLSLFVVADGMDAETGTPLVRIIGGPPEKTEMMARNETGVVDIRVRPQWREWSAIVTLRYDGAQFSAADVVNLMERVGAQCGVGEGRPDSRNSAGIGMGTFYISDEVG